MRVTQNSSFDTLRESVARTKGRMEKLQGQAATLKKLNTPSDDPVGSAKLLEIRTEKVNNEQFASNARLAETFLNNTDHAIGELVDIVVRAKEIAISQSSGASANDETRLGIAEEVAQLYNHGIAVANRRVGERYLFGGYKVNQPPVDPEGAYRGDSGQIMTEVSRDVFVPSNVPGIEMLNSNPRASRDAVSTAVNASPEFPAHEDNVNFFDEIQDLRIGLLTGDLESIRGTLERFDTMLSHLLAVRSQVGSRIQGINGVSQAMERHNVTNSQLASNIEDADMAQVVSDLSREEVIFRSALASSQKLIQPTLLDFLK